MIGAAFIDLVKTFDTVDHLLLCSQLERLRSIMMNCIGLCLILQVESNSVELMGQIPRLMQLALDYFKAHVLVLSCSLSISLTLLNS